jgi:6-phosphogluconolactonase
VAAKLTAVLTVAAGLGGVLSVSVSAEEDNSAGHVYVNDNTAGTNTIGAFDRHGDGSLTPISGSPFAAGGQGTGTIIGSQGALQLSSDGRYLLAVDAGSNQVSVLRIRRDGSLTAVGSPVWSGGFATTVGTPSPSTPAAPRSPATESCGMAR